jgi:hypothetical protein
MEYANPLEHPLNSIPISRKGEENEEISLPPVVTAFKVTTCINQSEKF